MPRQLFFDLDFSMPKTIMDTVANRPRKDILQRSVLRWLEQTKPTTSLAAGVITRISKLKADVAGFWSKPKKNTHEEGPERILVPTATIIVQCHVERDGCWPDCIKSKQILPQLRTLRDELAEAEAQIQENEPRLRRDDTLFEEYAEWNYENSTNRSYHRLRHAISKMEHGLYHGTKFERIRSAQLADYLYLAVPAGMVQGSELADGWGLLWIEDDLEVTVVVEAQNRECLPSNRMHLIQNIAAGAKNAELLHNGVTTYTKGEVAFIKPMRRRSRQTLRLSDL